MAEFYNPNATIDYTYDSEATQERLDEEARQEEIAQTQKDMEVEAAELEYANKNLKSKQPTTETPTPEAKPKETPPKEDGGFLGGMMETLPAGYTEPGAIDTDSMGGTQRVVAGGVDLLMDGVSALVPALQTPADWWDEKSGRNAGKDPYKKAERDMGGIMIGTLLTGGLVGSVASKVPGVVNLSARTKLLGQAAADLGIDAMLSGVSDTTSEAGNFATLVENLLPNGAQIPWASRDADSPDVIYAKNMTENMLLGTTGELVGALFTKVANKITPKNTQAAAELAKKQVKEADELAKAGGDPVVAAVNRSRQRKKDAQLGIAKKVLKEDPEGVNGYNAFVNDPAEPVARITLDEEASGLDFMTDQARIQNNVGTFDGRARPIINDAEIEALSRADAPTRASLLSKVEGELGAEFELTVGATKLTKQEVTEAVNNLYDTALQSEEGFEEALKSMRNTEANVFEYAEQIVDAGQREIMIKTAGRLLDAVSPQTQRASASIQTQAANSVSDIGRNIDLMADVDDTSRLQELALPRLRLLLKEVEISKTAQKVSSDIKAKFNKKMSTIDGALAFDDDYMYTLLEEFNGSIAKSGSKVDEFVDTLSAAAKQNPNFLRPLYRQWARTGGEIDTLYKMNKHINNRLGLINKALMDGKPEVPSIILRELEGLRMANILNGFAPAKAFIGNTTSLVLKPATIFAGSVPKALKGDLKPLQRAWYGFSGGLETFKRARKLAMDEWRFANANPDAAMARGRSDYNQSQGKEPLGTDWRKSLAEFEEFEELSETWDIGKQMIWNATKTVAYWNRKSWNRWGVHTMYGADGMVKSMMASFNSRTRAFDELLMNGDGTATKADFRKLEQQIYNDSFNEEGILTDKYAKFMSEETALNADVAGVKSFGKMAETFPVLKSIFMFPKTRVNQFGLIQTYDPTGLLGGWIDRSGKTITAKTPDQINDVLEMHGLAKGDIEGFEALKSEYIGRKMMMSGVVMTAAMGAFSGRLVGTGPLDPVENKKWRDLGGQPYSLNVGSDEAPDIRSYEQAPAWVKMPLSMISDLVMAYKDDAGEGLEDWLRTITSAMSANVTSDLFVNEVDQLAGILDFENGTVRYLAGMADTMIPGASVRSALSSILVPQLQDVENNIQSVLANRNRWIPGLEATLANKVDIFTGDPVGAGSSPLEIGLSKVLPGFKTKAGREPWRHWLLSTGWKGLSEIQTNPVTGEELSPPQREWVNNWIGKNMELDKKVEELMNSQLANDLEKYEDEALGKSQKKYPRAKTGVHRYLNLMMADAKKKAWAAYETMNAEMSFVKPMKEARDQSIQDSNFSRTDKLNQRIDTLTKTPN